MSILLNTSAGDIVIDLFTKECPVACENFLKLCTIKYYNQCLIYNVQPNYIVQSGDPTGTGKGGTSVFGILNGSEQRFFADEIPASAHAHYKKERVGYVGMAHISGHENSNQSQFFITLRAEDMELKKTHTIFGVVAEGLEILTILNELFCDEEGRPYQDVRILHTYVLDDPFPHPRGLLEPPESPSYEIPPEEKVKQRLPYSADPLAKTEEDENIEEKIKEKEARSRAIVLEMTGDLPDAEVKPPREVLFVCKLNPVTRDEDLELIFSRFGKIKSCEIIRDFLTGDSLNYAFIEFEDEESCIRAFEKMNNVLIDDRRIKVDFSQSVSKLWNRFLLKPRKDAPKGKDGSNKQQQDLSKYGPGAGNQGGQYKPRDNNERSNQHPYQRDHKHNAESDRSRKYDREDKYARGNDRDKERERSRDKDRDRDYDRDRKKDREGDYHRSDNKRQDEDRKPSRREYSRERRKEKEYGEDRKKYNEYNEHRERKESSKHHHDRDHDEKKRKRSQSPDRDHRRHSKHSRDRKDR